MDHDEDEDQQGLYLQKSYQSNERASESVFNIFSNKFLWVIVSLVFALLISYNVDIDDISIQNNSDISLANSQQNVDRISSKQNPTFQSQKDKNEIKEDHYFQIEKLKAIHNIIFPSVEPKKKYQQISPERVKKAFEYKALKDEGNQQLAKDQYEYYENKYNISKYQQLPFCIVVSSYNNVAHYRYRKNMDSIIRQNYSNYHIVFINDQSTDKTGELIDNYVRYRPEIQKKIKIIHNKKHLTALPNLHYAALNQCKPQQIYLTVDGDDQLVGRQVLKLFNAVFHQNEVYIVYSNFLFQNGNIGLSQPYMQDVIEDNTYRHYKLAISHLRAFYTKLFQLIDEKDLKDNNENYFTSAYDVAICIPMLEMAHKKVMYLKQITYLYNSDTQLNDHSLRLKQQKETDIFIRTKTPYKQIPKLFDQKRK